MQQTTEVSAETYQQRLTKLQDAMKEFGLQAIVLEPGPAMVYLTGVHWGKSAPAWVRPGFEEMRARELIRPGDDIRVWQEDESPYGRIVQALKDRGIAA